VAVICTTTGGTEQIQACLSVLVNPVELPNNDETRMCPGIYAHSHITSKGVRLY